MRLQTKSEAGSVTTSSDYYASAWTPAPVSAALLSYAHDMNDDALARESETALARIDASTD